MNYSLGLDLGSENIGWAVVQLDQNDNPIKLIDMGVRAFEAVFREGDNSETPAKERRLARSQRRRLRNKRKRRRKFIELAIKKGLVKDFSEANQYIESGKNKESPWILRVKGLDELLLPDEWFRVLYHLINHRGFMAEIKGEDKDRGLMKESAAKIRNFWKEKGYRTVAEFLEKDEEWRKKYGDRRRNKEGDYSLTIHRDDIIEEAKILFERQRLIGSSFADQDFEERFLEILNEEPKLIEGEDLLKLVGKCSFEDEPRAPRAALTSQLFVAYQTLAHLRVVDFSTGEERRLSKEEIERLIEKGFEKKEIKSSDVLQVCGINEGRLSSYSENDSIFSFKYFHEVKKAVGPENKKNFSQLRNPDYFDQIASILTYYKKEKNVKNGLSKIGLEEDVIQRLLPLSFKGHHRLSLKAMKKLIPYFKKGLSYAEALKEAGYESSDKKRGNSKISKIPPFDSIEADPEIKKKFEGITNPNVVRALTQARKVVNAIVEKYGLPSRVSIELAREFAVPYRVKKKIQEMQREREKEKKQSEEKIKEIFSQIGVEHKRITPKMIEKFILYEQQGGKSAYSLKEINLLRMLSDENYTEVDHIIPRSLSFDNSMANKVLVLTDDNRNKGDELASFFIKRHFGGEHFQRFKKEFVEATLKEKMKQTRHRYQEIRKKIDFLLKEELSEEEKQDVQRRFLNATSFMSRFFKDAIVTYFGDVKVVPVAGKITADLRYLSGLNQLKKRDESDKHHAVDAALCAVTDFKVIKKMANYYRDIEKKRRQKIKSTEFEEGFEPYSGFRSDVIERYNSLIVSRAPKKRVTGKGHKDTIYSIKHFKKYLINSGYGVLKKGRVNIPKEAPPPTKRVRLDQLSENEIREILEKPSAILVGEEFNRKLYSLIINRLKETKPQKHSEMKNWAKIAFGGTEKIYMPAKDGSNGPEVRKITIFTDVRSGLIVRGGIAENLNIVRLDFYRKKDKKGENKYYVVPVYTTDIVLGVNPDKAAIPGKDESEWVKIDNSFEFLFHLFKGEYLRVQKKENEEPFIIYLTSFDKNGARLVGNYHDRSNRKSGKIEPLRVSITRCYKIEKLYVDLLGNCYLVRKEKKIY
ncbi:MAG: type II CRISPR RNA-guided endonuclease Cas9 [Candidatus Aenigmatarchaeota archaeon]